MKPAGRFFEEISQKNNIKTVYIIHKYYEIDFIFRQ